MTPLEFCKANGACAESLKFARRFKTMNSAWRACKRSDWMLWALRRRSDIPKTAYVALAIAFAERVLPIFEKRYPENRRPREALDAARAWLKDPTEANREAAAAYAVDAYAVDAYAVDAYAAAYAADANVATTISAERRIQADIVRKHIPNWSAP